jgi:hypothetical protein
MDVAHQLHADDFQLVTPLGAVFSKEEYLGAVAAGHLHYLVWDLDSPINIRMYADLALIRYRAQVEIEGQGHLYPRAPYWFTDAYEQRDGGRSCGPRPPALREASGSIFQRTHLPLERGPRLLGVGHRQRRGCEGEMR